MFRDLKKMLFPVDGEYIDLEELLIKKFGSSYNIKVEELNSANFSVPQSRARIVYRIWKKGLKWDIDNSKKNCHTRRSYWRFTFS